MKLSNITAKLTCIRNKTAKAVAAATLAGALFTAAAPAAQAQRIYLGFGGPRYVAPPPPPPYGYYRGYGYGPGWRDRDFYYRHHYWEHDRWYPR